MKKGIFNIFLIIILTTLIVGCTVGATDTSKDFDDGENNVENQLQQEEHSSNEDSEEKNDSNKDVEAEEDEDKKDDEKEEDSSDDGKESNTKEDEQPNSDTEEKLNNDNNNIKIHYSGDESKKYVALTFDDGPESEHTSQILDILDEYNIKATFFIIGQNGAKHVDVLKDIHNRGHEIGSHSWSHKYLPKISKESKKKEILKVEQLLVDVLGEYTPIFRPPYGAVKKQDKQLLNSLGYKIVNWSVDTRDWAGTSSEQMMKYVKEQLKPGGIILMHNSGNVETVPNLINTLPTIIDWIIEQGYEFVTVTQLLD